MPDDELLFSSTCGPPIAASTAVSRDIGIHAHALASSWPARASFKKSSSPPHGLAVNDSHIFAAQHQKAHVHVYSRLRGTHDALVSFQERVCCLALAGDVLVLGTADGRLMLWETCSGRLATTPPCHFQAVTCLVVAPHHVLSASDDSNVNVWPLARLLDPAADMGHQPDLTLSNHRAAVTDLAVGPGANSETCLCVSASRDKTCMLWNYQTGQLLRTLLFPAPPLCLTLGPWARALFVAAGDGGLYLVELFGPKPLLGPRSAELPSTVVQLDAPLALADGDAGPASCLALSHDGTLVFTGHAKGKILRWTLTDNGHAAEVADLNACVTNLVSAPPIQQQRLCRNANVVKPNQSQRQYTWTTQLQRHLDNTNSFLEKLDSTGIHPQELESAIFSLSAPTSGEKDATRLQRENDELRAIVEEQKALHKATVQYQEAARKP